jgi:hypothetical protein
MNCNDCFLKNFNGCYQMQNKNDRVLCLKQYDLCKKNEHAKNVKDFIMKEKQNIISKCNVSLREYPHDKSHNISYTFYEGSMREAMANYWKWDSNVSLPGININPHEKKMWINCDNIHEY